MTLKNCILTNNPCFKRGQQIKKVTGIVVHSTACNNPYLKRYVQPNKDVPNYAALISDLGVNRYDNDWNHENASACVHAFIGKNAAEEIETYQTLPFNYCCWGCGRGKNGSYNYPPNGRIQFEICEDSTQDPAYYAAVMSEASEFCAMLCEQYNLTSADICSHTEAGQRGYGTKHGDPEHWMKIYGHNMNDFRGWVDEKLKPKSENHIYLVYTGIYNNPESAKAEANKLKCAGFAASIAASIKEVI